MESVLAKSTSSTYATGNRQYIQFCKLHSISDPYPAQEDYILGFITFLYMNNKASSTIHVYLYAIRYHQLYTYNTDPLKGHHKIEALVKAIKRIKRVSQKQRIPITIPILDKIKTFLNMSTYDHQVIWAALVLGVYGLLRTSELAQNTKDSSLPLPTATSSSSSSSSSSSASSSSSSYDYRLLLVSNIKVISDSHFILTLRASKTDPYKMGADIHYFANHSTTCPLLAIKPLLAHQKESWLPLLALSDGKPLTTTLLIQSIRLLIIQVEKTYKLGLDHNMFSGYSLRRGGATSLYEAGLSETTIKTMGRWRSYCFRLYIDTPIYILKDAQTYMSELANRPQQAMSKLPAFWDIESPAII